MAKKPTEIKGIHIISTGTFYYLESNGINVPSAIERIMKSLIARDLLTFSGTREEIEEPKYQILSLAEAKNKNLAIEAVYLTPHVKQLQLEVPQDQQTISWAKK